MPQAGANEARLARAGRAYAVANWLE